MYGAKSMDNLATPTHSRPDPFDTSQFWPEQSVSANSCETQSANRSKYDTQAVSRPNYDLKPVSRSNYDTQPVSRPNYDIQPVRSNYDIQPASGPNYDLRAVSRQVSSNFETQAVSRPNYDKQPVSRSNYDTQPVSRTNYDIQPSYEMKLEPSTSVSQNESQRYSTNNYASTSDSTHYNNRAPISKNSLNPQYGTVPVSSSTYVNANALSLERNLPNISTSLAEMSLDDRISQSLNLRKNENLYSNNSYQTVPSTSAGPSNVNENRYNDIPIYSNFDINPAQQQFLLETKDYYTKYSTPAKTNTSDDYEKNIYVPKYEDEPEKLKNFSESLENSKNYSAFKYQNVDYGYPSYSNNYGNDLASTSRLYDEVNETASNFYSEIVDANPSVYGATPNLYTNACLYDEVYEESVPRPHRPAPPCPTKPK